MTVYINDILDTSRNQNMIKDLTSYLSKAFEINHINNVKYCLGKEFLRINNGVTMHEWGYIKGILDRYKMNESSILATSDGSLNKITKERRFDKWKGM